MNLLRIFPLGKALSRSAAALARQTHCDAGMTDAHRSSASPRSSECQDPPVDITLRRTEKPTAS